MSTAAGKSTKQFLTLPEVQSYLGVKSRKTILKYIKSGELPAYKLGGTRWRILRGDIETFLRKQHSHLQPREGKKKALTAQVTP